MMNFRFEFATASRIVFGNDSIQQVPDLTAELGQRVLMVTGRNPNRSQVLKDLLTKAGRNVAPFEVASEPTVEVVTAGVELARSIDCDVVIAQGGGSVIDAGKAIAILKTHDGAVLDYLEVVGRGLPLTRPSTPFIAVPTTAGTGAEVTRNAVLSCTQHRVKASLRSPHLLPRAAVVDPALTRCLTPELTAATGMDALSQLIEPFVTKTRNPMTDLFCRDGIPRIARSLRQAWREGSDACARSDMAMASLLGGLALANSGLGAVHGFAAPLGGMYSAPHGALCARLLPGVMRANVRALRRTREAAQDVLSRYQELARMLTGNEDAVVEDGLTWIEDLCLDLGIPSLSCYGVKVEELPLIIKKAMVASSMRGNPVVLEEAELNALLAAAL